jgi:HYDIN/CFA65/VesB-like, Ig-like domain
MGKWFLRDWRSPQRVLVGKLNDVHDSSGILDGGDNDTNLEIVPRGDFAGLLENRHNQPNKAKDGQPPVIECEVNVGSDWRSQYEFFVNSLVDREVTAQGVFVDDDGHDSKTELHPMDVIFARVDDSQLPGDWIGALAARRGLVLNQSLFVTRFAAASDDREGVVLSGPPLASWDRPTTITLPLPPVPPGTGWVPDFSLQIMRQEKATVDTAVVGDKGSDSQAIQLTITCQGRDYGGPGVVMGEIGTFWTSQTAPAIQISPTRIPFGKVTVKDVADRTVTITNTGQADLVITIASPGQHAVFTWEPVSGQAIAPGTSATVDVQFAPPGVGPAQGQLRVDSNAAGSPHIVTLEGTGVKGSPS